MFSCELECLIRDIKKIFDNLPKCDIVNECGYGWSFSYNGVHAAKIYERNNQVYLGLYEVVPEISGDLDTAKQNYTFTINWNLYNEIKITKKSDPKEIVDKVLECIEKYKTDWERYKQTRNRIYKAIKVLTIGYKQKFDDNICLDI